jgi:hypothetical protein
MHLPVESPSQEAPESPRAGADSNGDFCQSADPPNFPCGVLTFGALRERKGHESLQLDGL